jgi:hypothetical protein
VARNFWSFTHWTLAFIGAPGDDVKSGKLSYW